MREFFRPAEVLTNQEAIAHRQQISRAWPGLPAVAGRAYQALIIAQQAWQQAPTASLAVPRPGNHRLTADQLRVRAIRRPQPDLERLAQALIEVARYDIEHGYGPDEQQSA